MVLVHEAGHAVAAEYATPAAIEIHVWPGYEVYPEFGKRTHEPWPKGAPAFTALYPQSAPIGQDANGLRMFAFDKNEMYLMQRHSSLIALMGTAATTLLALVSLSMISLFQPKGLVLWCLAAGSLLHLDMLTYAVLPTFVGVRHLYFIGGETAEPVDALSGLGFPVSFSLTAIILLSLLQCAWLYYLLRFRLHRGRQ